MGAQLTKNDKRTCYVAELSAKDIGRHVCLMGWVQRQRDLGSLIFVDLRDRSGIIQLAFDESTDQKTYLNRYNAAIKFLTLVAEGKVSIGTETEDPASAAATGFSAKSNPRLFTRAKMRGM